MEIPKAKQLDEKVFAISNEKDFSLIALDVFEFQFHYNPLYQTYCRAIGKNPDNVKLVSHIPFLPISVFKSHQVKTTAFEPEVIFKSSGTTGTVTSSHFVKDTSIYKRSFFKGFSKFYGDVADYCVIGLLPSYLERGNSSLVYMVRHLILESSCEKSGFYLNEFEELNKILRGLKSAGKKTLLIGVTYALMDFARSYPQELSNTVIMETGGMKGRGKELVREELYGVLKKAFGVSTIHSEYGMTELLSQAYGVDGIMNCPGWMKIFLRDETDPLTVCSTPELASGAINIVDLANLYSCSFIATEDVGRLHPDGRFEILGRMDNSDIRGCSLLVI